MRSSDSSLLSVHWLGLSAVYTPAERIILAELPLREQTLLHALKALTEGEISFDRESGGHQGLTAELGDARPEEIPVYIDADDIPFGDGPPVKKTRPVYALVWTDRKHRMVKTKAKATRTMRAWKKWYERNGWRVSSHADGYFAASPSGERHAIVLHEYDAVTHERR